MERASVDEAYIDITKLVEKRIEEGLQICETDLPNTFVVGHDEKVGIEIENNVKSRKLIHEMEIILMIDLGRREAFRIKIVAWRGQR